MTLPAPALGLLCAVALGFGSGCGATEALDSLSSASEELTKAQYVLQMQALIADVRADARRIRDGIASPGALGRTVDQVRVDLERIADRLRRIRPPTEIGALHDRVAAAVGRLGGIVGRAQSALGTGDLATLIGLVPAVQEEVGAVGEVSREFAARGYALESEGAPGP